MAIISKEKLIFEDKEFIRTIRVLKDGLFYIKLPDTVNDKISISEVSDETRDGALKKWKETIDLYRKSQTITKKVILYEIEYGGEIWGDPKYREDYDEERFKDYDEVCLLSHHERGFNSDGMELSVKASVFIEEEIVMSNGKIKYNYLNVPKKEDLPLGLYSNSMKPMWGNKATNQIDWTPERHKFFDDFYKAMSNLILKIHLISRDKKTLFELIDHGKKLIPEIT